MDGFNGCYRGLAPKLIGSIVGVVASKRVADKLGLNENDESDSKDDSEITEEEWYCDTFSYIVSIYYHANTMLLQL